MPLYVPKHFEESRPEVLRDLIERYPFACLVTHSGQGITANHLPFLFDPAVAPHGLLRGHVARANAVWRESAAEQEALTIFQGPNAYVSPSWYPSKQDDGRVVPTWNYAVVHVYGRVRFIEDRDWLRRLVEDLTQRHERDRPAPWQVGDAPADYIDKLLAAIVGVELRVERMVGKVKASQNRSAQDIDGVAAGLRATGGDATAAMADLVEMHKGR